MRFQPQHWLRFSTRLTCPSQAWQAQPKSKYTAYHVIDVWTKTGPGYQPPRIHTTANVTRGMNTIANAVYSGAEDIERISKEVASLIHRTDRGWALSVNGKGLERSFKFKNFKTTWGFMNVIAKECAVQHHHPEWSNSRQIYNTTFIRWTTHNPSGLSMKDIQMAKFCDEQAIILKEIQETSDTCDETTHVRDLAAQGGGDCCTPKS